MLIYVNLSQIDDNPFQRRSEYGDIADLASRIAAAKDSYPDSYGLMQIPRGRLIFRNANHPDGVTVKDNLSVYAPDSQLVEDSAIRVQLAFGHRRLRAFRHLLEQKTEGYIDALFPIHIDPLDDDQMLNAVWSENRERKDISAVEEAEMIQMKMEMMGESATQTTVATEWGLGRSTIANRLRLLDLPEDVQAANRTGQLSERQCLALKPIIEIDALVNGHFEWGGNIAQSWGIPAGADAVIKTVLEQPNQFTSDQLRQHAKSMATNAGRILPDCVARHNYGEAPGIEQPKCKGCRFRYDQRCLGQACLTRKKEAWVEFTLEAFSQESGIPISDRAKDFTDDYGIATHIKKLYETGITDGMVCAWQEETPAARPFCNSPYSTGNFSENGRAGIALGWRGELPPLPSEPVDDSKPHYDLPALDVIAAWSEEDVKIAAAAKRELLAAVADALSYQVAEFDVIQTLMNPADAERVDEADKLAKHLASFLFDKGRRINWYNTFYDTVDAYQLAANCAGLQISVLGDEKETTRKTAVLILVDWYDAQDGYYWERDGNDALERIERWQQLPDAATSAMTEDIDRAKLHIQQKIEKEGETAVSREAS